MKLNSRAYGKTIYGATGLRPYGGAGDGMVGKPQRVAKPLPAGRFGRTYLIVPFEQRALAKHLGAFWDASAKHWYITSTMNPKRFMRWMRPAQLAPVRRHA